MIPVSFRSGKRRSLSRRGSARNTPSVWLSDVRAGQGGVSGYPLAPPRPLHLCRRRFSSLKSLVSSLKTRCGVAGSSCLSSRPSRCMPLPLAGASVLRVLRVLRGEVFPCLNRSAS